MRSLALVVLSGALLAHLSLVETGAAQTDDQTILGPGLYVFQTRTRGATCNDDERNGYVSSFVAPIHGVPGSRRMSMQLINTDYWSRWTIRVEGDDRVIGDSTMNRMRGPSAPRNHFEVTRQGDRFIGTGTRTYTRTVDGRAQECAVTYDALLRRIDAL